MKNTSKALLILSLLWLGACSEPFDSRIEPPHIIKSAHYFSDTAPFVFWQEYEQKNVVSDLQQIKNDGFNTIVLVVPWKGFERNLSATNANSDTRLYARLESVIAEITKLRLHYFLRLGYPHDFSVNPTEDQITECRGLFSSEQYQNNWRRYLEKIHHVTQKYDDYLLGTLVSWEDFWCPHFTFPYLPDDERLVLANQLGYGTWLADNKFLEESEKPLFQNIPNPQNGGQDYVHYSLFIDRKIDQLIVSPLKQVFGKASMEVRIDTDRSSDAAGNTFDITHNLHLKESHYRGTYWAPYWGRRNTGQVLSAREALPTFEYYLQRISDQGRNTKIVIEQLNFFDNTPGHEVNAQFQPDEVDDFFQAAVPLLKKYTKGYGVWAYRNYAENVLYNASFELGLAGWLSRDAEVLGNDNDRHLSLAKGGSISQRFYSYDRFKFHVDYQQLDLCLNVLSGGAAELHIKEDVPLLLQLQQGKQCFKVPAHSFVNGTTEFKLTATTALMIDELKFYGFVQRLDMYNEHNQADRYLQAVRELNQAL